MASRISSPRATPRACCRASTWRDDVAGSTNYLTMRPGGFTVETTADGETVRTYLDVGENPPARRDRHLPAGRRTRGADRPDLP